MKLNKEERKNLEGLETRTMALEFTRGDDENDRRVSLSFASEEPVLRSFGWEILSHERKDIDLNFMESGRAPLLLNHNPEVQIGVIESANLDATERKSRSVVRFGKGELASEIFADVTDKIRTNISVGYSIDNLVKMDETRDGSDVYRAAWTPMEISLVSIPADRSDIGVGRAEIEKPIIEKNKMENTKTEVVSEKPNFDAEKIVSERLAERAKTNKEILALAARHNKRDLADHAIANNTDIDVFRGQLLSQIESKPLDSVDEPIDIAPKEAKRYSLLKALNASSRGDWQGAGFEAEMSQESALKRGKQPQGFYVPDFAWNGNHQKRELTVGTNASGGFFAPSAQLGSEWIDALRANMVLPGLGMQIMSGLSTKIQIPKVSAGASAAFVAESGAVSDNTQTTAQLTLVARTLGARTSCSRLLLLESDPSIEAIVRNDLVAAVANKIEDVLIEGGGSNEPTGITQVGGNLGTVALGTNGAAPTWAAITNLVKEVETDNAAINAGTLGFLTNPKAKSKLANTAKVGSSDSVMILNDPWNALYGYPMAITTNCPSDLTKGTGSALSAMIFGDFSQLIMASFGGGPDILVDPYSSSNDGTVKILIFSEIDSAVKHDESFAVITDMITT